jgi:hypothetical protein
MIRELCIDIILENVIAEAKQVMALLATQDELDFMLWWSDRCSTGQWSCLLERCQGWMDPMIWLGNRRAPDISITHRVEMAL